MPGFRIERINREMLREISDLIRTRIKDDSVRWAMLSEVDCSRDLSHAKVFFRTLPPGNPEEVKRSLDRVSGTLRGLLGRRMRLRQIPELHFVYDTTEDKARSIDAVLDSLEISVNRDISLEEQKD
jgi:ribosome-binding factor A